METLDLKGAAALGEVMVAWLDENDHLKSIETSKLRLQWLRDHLGDDTYLDEIDPEAVAKAKAKDKWNGNPVLHT